MTGAAQYISHAWSTCAGLHAGLGMTLCWDSHTAIKPSAMLSSDLNQVVPPLNVGHLSLLYDLTTTCTTVQDLAPGSNKITCCSNGFVEHYQLNMPDAGEFKVTCPLSI